MILGHESLGTVLDVPADSGFAAGDLVAGIVRYPDPLPCANCAAGEWDMCRNGQYRERGIKQLHGFYSERFRTPSQFALRVGHDTAHADRCHRPLLLPRWGGAGAGVAQRP